MTLTEQLNLLPEREREMVLAYLQAPPGVDPLQHAAKVAGISAGEVAALLTTPRLARAVDQGSAEVAALVAQPHVLALAKKADPQDPVIDSAWVLHELVRLQSASVRDFLTLDDHGRLRFDLSEENAAALDDMQAFEMSETVDNLGQLTRTLKFKLPDKLRATELIGKHHAVRAFEARDEADETDEQMVARIRAGRDRLARLKHGSGDQ